MKDLKKILNSQIFSSILQGTLIIFLFMFMCILITNTVSSVEDQVYNNFCNYAVEKGIINKEEYVNSVYPDDQEMAKVFSDTFSEEDLCVDIYVRYLTELSNGVYDE